MPEQLYRDTVFTINRITKKTMTKKYLGVFEFFAVSATCCIVVGVLFIFCIVGIFCIVLGILEMTASTNKLLNAVGDAEGKINEFLDDLNRNEFYEYGLRFHMASESVSYGGDYADRYFIEITSTK